MTGYLGETLVEDLSNTKFANYGTTDWALYFAAYGQEDGEHHKAWAIDQVCRVLKNTPVIVKLAKWDNGCLEYRVVTGNPSDEYLQFVSDFCNGEDGPNTYSWDEGIAP